MGLNYRAANFVWDGEVDAQPKASDDARTAPRRRSGRNPRPMRGVWLKPQAGPNTAPADGSSPVPRRSPLMMVWRVLGAILGFVWFCVTAPFRLAIWILALLGRIASLVVGFSLMVLGSALLPGPLFPIGLAVFVLGMVMTLRSVE